MMTVRQIGLLFGFFLSMFYIFKYGNPVPTAGHPLCKSLNDLQIKAVAELGPYIRADPSDRPFDEKLQSALMDARHSAEYMQIQQNIYVVKSQLKGQSCPAPTLSQMARLAVDI